MLEQKIGHKNLTPLQSCSCLNHKQTLHFFQNLNTKNLKISSWIFDLNQLAKIMIQFYQATFSFFLGGNCRYYPSCSHYAVECFEQHNFLKATWLTLKRLASCHPFSRKNLYDPVPFNLMKVTPHE